MNGRTRGSEYLGVGMRTVNEFLDQGLIPAYKLGRVIRMKRADLDAFLEANRIEPGSCDTSTRRVSRRRTTAVLARGGCPS